MYFGGFDSKQDLISNFNITEADLEGCTVLFAAYALYSYEGSAFVLYEKDNVLYEVNGSHCSCYGLEEQWIPEETSWLDIYHRVTAGRLGHLDYDGENFVEELLSVIRRHWGLA